MKFRVTMMYAPEVRNFYMQLRNKPLINGAKLKKIRKRLSRKKEPYYELLLKGPFLGYLLTRIQLKGKCSVLKGW